MSRILRCSRKHKKFWDNYNNSRPWIIALYRLIIALYNLIIALYNLIIALYGLIIALLLPYIAQ